MIKKEEFSIFGTVFWIHLTTDIIFYASPFLFSWWIILIGAILLQIQYIVFNGCVLTKAQFGKEEDDLTCIGYYFEKVGFKFKRRNIKIAVRYVSPVIVFIFSLFWQVLLGYRPLIF